MIDWRDIVSPRVAIEQSSWERGRSIVRAREVAKMRFSEIGRRFNISRKTAQLAYAKAKQNRPAPVELYQVEQRDIRKLVHKLTPARVTQSRALQLQRLTRRKPIK